MFCNPKVTTHYHAYSRNQKVQGFYPFPSVSSLKIDGGCIYENVSPFCKKMRKTGDMMKNLKKYGNFL